MINLLLRNIGRFVVLVLLQVLIIDNIQFSEYINPFIYVLFILLLPFETPGWLLLVLAFFLGFSVDLFEHTPGLHASATVFMAFLRPLVLKILSPRDDYEPNTFPRIYYYGFVWFFKYAFILVFMHHLLLFYVEVFSFSNFFMTFLKVLLSTLFSLVLIIISQYLVYKK
jgi:hypothetical protein